MSQLTMVSGGEYEVDVPLEQARRPHAEPAKRSRKTRESRVLHAERLLSASDVSEIYGVSLRSLWRLLAAGKIPRPDLRVGRLPRWRQETIAAHVQGS